MNKENKKIWDDIFEKQPELDDSVMCKNENGNYVAATPIGFGDEQKTYDALKDIIEGAIKKKNYKTWHIGTKLIETYTEEHLPIEEYDVIYFFSKDWEEPLFFAMVKNITDTNIEYWWLGGEDNETICKANIPLCIM